MKGCALLAFLLANPEVTFAYTVTISAEPIGDQPSLFRNIELPSSRFVEKELESGSSFSPETSSYTLSNMSSAARIKTEEALSELGARKEGSRIIVSLPSDVLFDFDKSDIRSDARPVLARLAEVLGAMGKAPVTIIGHTDWMGSDSYNQRLSKRRAASVKSWLSERGVASPMLTDGRGESEPVAPNANNDGSDNPEGRQKNRRVDFIIGED